MTSSENKDCNISLSINESESDADVSFDVSDFLSETYDDETHQDLSFSMSIDYQVNFNVRQLLQICDYYGISKDLKLSKCTKDIVISALVDYETNPENECFVTRRRELWFYISELKNDKFMKKYIFW